MLKLTTRVPGQPTTTIAEVAVARDIALVATAIMRMPFTNTLLRFENTKSANPDIHANGVVPGAKIIHRDKRVPFTDEYLRVLHVHRYSSDSGMQVRLTVRPYHDRDDAQRFDFIVPASQTVELFTIEQLPTR